jgi:hypothetical protein
MKLSTRISEQTAIRLALVAALLGVPQFASAAARTFQSLTVTPPSTNLTAGASVAANVALTTRISSGTTASGQVTNIVSITPPASGVTLNINPDLYVIGTSLSSGQTSNSTLTVTTSPATPPNTYVIQVVVAAGPTNPNLASITPITNTFSLTVASGASESFFMTVSPALTNVFRGVATNFSATVSFTDNSSTISGTISNGVTVTGPDLVNVSANLNSIYAPVTNNFGQTNLVLTISATANTAPGTYRVIVCGTNGDFTANSPIAGVASVTNTFVVTDSNSFSMSVSPASTSVIGGTATNVSATVTLTDNSPVLSGVLTNGVRVSPSGQGVTASLNNTLVSVNSGGGQGTLILTVNATASATPGTYQVIAGATNNDFTANSPVPGIASVTNALVVVAPPTPLSIDSFSLSGTNLTFTGFGGGPNGQYVVYSATNLALPLAQWTPVMTNVFDADGNFNALIPLASTPEPNADQQFFVIGLPLTGTDTIAIPRFSPAARPYYAETAVTITTATSGATIRYTTDGSTPSESNGLLYTGPVMMRGPVNTNSAGTITNASGVTMLKAVAYKGGKAPSVVWTGIYTILDQGDYPPASVPSPLIGISHVAYNVSSPNWNSTVDLWTNYYGFAAVVASNDFALIKINDQQFIEMYRVPLLVSNQWQLANYGFEVTNAEAYRQQLSAAGVAVPPSVSLNALGNLSFLTVDPDGHTNEWVQYLTNSVTGLSQGLYMPGTQVVGFANAFGITTVFGSQNVLTDPPINYYVTNCGFLGTGHSFDIPSGGKHYIELLTAGPSGATQDTAGKHGKLQFMNFRGMTIFQTINILTNRDPSIVYVLAPESRHFAFDVDTADLSRVRINDF